MTPDDPIEARSVDPLTPPDAVALTGRIGSLRGYLRGFAARKLNSTYSPSGEASDLAHETCVAAFRDQDQFRGTSDGELKAWLRTILNRSLLNLLRRDRTQKRDESGVVSLHQPGAEGVPIDVRADMITPSSVVSRNEQAELLNRALNRLTPYDRQIIVWRNHEDLPFEVIGKRLGGSPDMARKAWYRALERLRLEFDALSPAS
ncbi:MAG: sigma-70 family RNA polymerase sigma factor [Isosphaeraceae bacterium]